MLTSINKDVKTKIDDLTALLTKNNIEICEIDDEFINIDSRLFPEVTFENSPQEVELKLVK